MGEEPGVSDGGGSTGNGRDSLRRSRPESGDGPLPCGVTSLRNSPPLPAVGVDGTELCSPSATPVNTQKSFTRERFVRVKEANRVNPSASKADSRPSMWCRESVANVSSWNPRYGQNGGCTTEDARLTFVPLELELKRGIPNLLVRHNTTRPRPTNRTQDGRRGGQRWSDHAEQRR